MEVGELLKIVLQDGNKDCGVCSLLSIIRYYNGNVSKEYLRELTGTTKNGVSLYQLMEAAKYLGFTCEGVKGDFLALDISKVPFIAHIVYQKKYQHFVVVYKVDSVKNEVVIMDPAKGKVILSFSEFRLLSSGYFLYLMPVKNLAVFQNVNILKGFIKRFYRRYRWYLFFIFFLSLLSITCQFITAFQFQFLYDYAIKFSIYQNLLILSIFIFLFYLCQILSQAIKNFILIKVSAIFDEELMIFVYKQILLLPYLFYKNRTLGEVLERMKDIIKIKNFIMQLFSILVTDVLFFLVFLILLSRIQRFLTFILICYIAISFLEGCLFYKKKKKRQKKVVSKSDYIQSFLIESFQNVDTLKGLHLEYDFLEQFCKEYKNYLNHSYKMLCTLEFEDFIRQFFYYVMLLLVYGIGSYFIIRKQMTIAQFFIFQYVFHHVIGCSERLISFFFESYHIPIIISRITDLFTLTRENYDNGFYYQLNSITGDIQFSHLNFSYTSKSLFLDFSFHISFGDKILLTGPSGSGKSSLVKMLMRYLDIPFGMLRIGNIDINHFHLDLLRSRISYVTGGELLFSNTIYYNITLGRDINQSKVEEVSHLVLLDEIVEKTSLGFQTMVEENGFNFSAGERQRILLARALLKNSDIFIFDEAFHQIDIVKEGEILRNIFSYLKGKTIIVISHRLQHLEFYDHKYRLEDGIIYEL